MQSSSLTIDAVYLAIQNVSFISQEVLGSCANRVSTEVVDRSRFILKYLPVQCYDRFLQLIFKFLSGNLEITPAEGCELLNDFYHFLQPIKCHLLFFRMIHNERRRLALMKDDYKILTGNKTETQAHGIPA